VNERIQELWNKAADSTTAFPSGQNNSWETQVNFMEKFAELIVRECVQTLQDNTPVLDENESLEDWNKGYIRAMLDCEHHIQEHFGVE
jgi:hypothetical protein